MDKNPVARAFSIGAISSGGEASDDFFNARRHSSAGIRALLWATSSAKSFGCSRDSQTSHESIYPNILTPDSIPQFTIPSLAVQTGSWDQEAEEKDVKSKGGCDSSVSLASATNSSSSSSSRLNLSLSVRRAERSVSDPLSRSRPPLQRNMNPKGPHKEDQQCLDPASRAALSLPHLTKVTTSYGFVTLSQSPQMASEEALLHQAGLRRLQKDNKPLSYLSRNPKTNTDDSKDKSSCLLGAKKKLSRDSADLQTKDRVLLGESKTSCAAASVASSSTHRQPDAKLKRRFYEVIRKYFINHHSK